MAAHAFAMEATVNECAALIDRGSDIKLETAMLKIWSTDALWTIVNDTIQIYGGQAFFCDEPYERMMRDARLNMIGEGANDVLRLFVAMVGMKPVIDQLLGLKNALAAPFKELGTLLSFGAKRVGARVWERTGRTNDRIPRRTGPSAIISVGRIRFNPPGAGPADVGVPGGCVAWIA